MSLDTLNQIHEAEEKAEEIVKKAEEKAKSIINVAKVRGEQMLVDTEADVNDDMNNIMQELGQKAKAMVRVEAADAKTQSLKLQDLATERKQIAIEKIIGGFEAKCQSVQ